MIIPVNCDPENRLERLNIDELEPFQRDLKSLDKEQYDELRDRIAKNGWLTPVFYWDNNGQRSLLDGHQRLRVVVTEGWEIDGGIPAVEIAAENEAEAFRNLLAITSTYGKIEGQGLYEAAAHFNVNLEQEHFSALPQIAYDWDTFLAEYFDAPVIEERQDTTPELTEESVVRLGDYWHLGDHRLLIGDATSADSYERLFSSELSRDKDVVPSIMVTDPPYGVEYDATWRDEHDLLDTHAEEVVHNDDRADWGEAWALFEGDVAYVWHADRQAHSVLKSLIDNDFEIRSQIIWAKQGFVFGRGHYHYQHEPCFYAVRKSSSANWEGGRKQSTLWEFDNHNLMKGGTADDGKTSHSTQKPIEAMARPMRNHGEDGDIVYDPFLGSGTTIIAGEQENRTVYGCELSPQYGEMIIRRWQNYTKQEALLNGTQTLEQLEGERQNGCNF